MKEALLTTPTVGTQPHHRDKDDEEEDHVLMIKNQSRLLRHGYGHNHSVKNQESVFTPYYLTSLSNPSSISDSSKWETYFAFIQSEFFTKRVVETDGTNEITETDLQKAHHAQLLLKFTPVFAPPGS
ncbi:hypothetical protein HGM15179_002952 [Zosterops borbonicus]|uniref:Uncharacterized protein n=1 Tax=Zosterops borbonicus TaxID=364589 RepID=A0A8K1GUM8_9PASS|nr:hypothetical protein HGM15179_002952 [Zosterops borbonicus]